MLEIKWIVFSVDERNDYPCATPDVDVIYGIMKYQWGCLIKYPVVSRVNALITKYSLSLIVW